MTAAEWRERKVVTDLDTETILADLASGEAEAIDLQEMVQFREVIIDRLEDERDDLRRQVKEYADAYTELDEDEADLRRKLEETELQRDTACEGAAEFLRQNASLSLANAVPRKALELWMQYADLSKCGEPRSIRKAFITAENETACVLDIPADGLAEEVAGVIRDARQLLNVVGIWKPPVDEQWRMSWQELTPRLDALLAKLGGGK